MVGFGAYDPAVGLPGVVGFALLDPVVGLSAVAGFASAGGAYRFTVERSSPSSRAIRRCDQPHAAKAMIFCCKLTLSSFIATRATPCRTGRNLSLKVVGFDPFPTGWFYPTADISEMFRVLKSSMCWSRPSQLGLLNAHIRGSNCPDAAVLVDRDRASPHPNTAATFIKIGRCPYGRCLVNGGSKPWLAVDLISGIH